MPATQVPPFVSTRIDISDQPAAPRPTITPADIAGMLEAGRISPRQATRMMSERNA